MHEMNVLNMEFLCIVLQLIYYQQYFRNDEKRKGGDDGGQVWDILIKNHLWDITPFIFLIYRRKLCTFQVVSSAEFRIFCRLKFHIENYEVATSILYVLCGSFPSWNLECIVVL